MTASQKIIKNSFFLSGGNVIAKLINLVLALFLTRLLGSKGFGIYNFAFAYVMIFLVFTHLGMNTLLVREIAKDKSRSVTMLATAFPIMFLLTALVFCVINLIPALLSWAAAEQQIIFLFSLYMIFDGMSRFNFSVFRAYEQMEYEALVYVTERIGLLIVTLFSWYAQASLEKLVSGFALVMFIKFLHSTWLVYRHFWQFKMHWRWQQAKALLKVAYPFALMSIFSAMSIRIDTLMLKMLHSPEAVGLYSTGRKLVESIAFLPENIAFAMFPALSVLFVQDKVKLGETFQQILKYMLIIAIPFMVGAFVFAKPFIMLLFEAEFIESYIVLEWLAFWLGILFLKHTFATLLNAIGKQGLFSFFAGISLCLNIILNYWLIPKYHIWGASVATVAAEVVGTLLMMIAAKKYIHLPRFSSDYLRLFVIAVLFYLISDSFSHLNPLIAVPILATIYTILLFILRAISQADYRYFKSLIRAKMPDTRASRRK